MSLEVVILAAGKGTRMKSGLPKVMQQMGGRPLVEFVFLTALRLNASRIHLVTGNDDTLIRSHLENLAAEKGFNGDALNWVKQDQQLGTGHAVQQAAPYIEDSAVILVLYADVPLVRAGTLTTLIERAGSNALALLASVVPDASGYGRILRDEAGNVTRIVEDRDCSHEQLKLKEINTGILAAPGESLKQWLSGIDNQNKQNEYYLTDIIALAHGQDVQIQTVKPKSAEEFMGVNDLADLASVERAYQLRNADELMHAGVTIRDPARIDIRGEVEIGAGSVIDVNVVIEGPSTLGREVQVGPNTTIRSSTIGNHTCIRENCVVEDARIGTDAIVGPFARLRPGTRLADHVHVGNFVEVKNSELREGVKANHLSYIGDATVGETSNIGAGVITCNYDGAKKHHTEIGRDVFVGSDVQLVAPVTVGDNASIGAGSTITSDVPENSLAVSRGKQRNISGWSRPTKKQTR